MAVSRSNQITWPPPALVVHADWSVRPRKRWAVTAARRPDGRYHLSPPGLVGDPARWLAGLQRQAGGGALLIGLDFPLGLPRSYAQQAGVTDFLALLPRLGQGAWADFYRVAETPAQIGLHRPFYPRRPGGTRRRHLLDRLGVNGMDDLRRTCDLPRPGRRAAAPLFWTMGAQQVGKAAIAGWRELVAPALAADPPALVWPFSGRLATLLQPGRTVLAEAYPAEFYLHLDLRFGPRGGKRRPAARRAQAERILAWAVAAGVTLHPALAAAVAGGFVEGAGGATENAGGFVEDAGGFVEDAGGFVEDAGGEDGFDATVGVCGLLNVLLGRQPLHEPATPVIRQIEGWILGQPGRLPAGSGLQGQEDGPG